MPCCCPRTHCLHACLAAQLPYTEACFQEALRMYPPAHLTTRETGDEPFTVPVNGGEGKGMQSITIPPSECQAGWCRACLTGHMVRSLQPITIPNSKRQAGQGRAQGTGLHQYP